MDALLQLNSMTGADGIPAPRRIRKCTRWSWIAARHDFASFYEKESRYRSWMHYPPHSALANVLLRSDKLDDALKFSGIIGRWFEATRHEGIRVMGPAPAPIVRLKNDYRYHFVLKSTSREKLNQTLRAMLAHAAEQKIPRTQIIVDMDALWLM